MQMSRDQLEFAISQYMDGTLPPFLESVPDELRRRILRENAAETFGERLVTAQLLEA